MVQDQRRVKSEHGHLKDSLKKQGKSDQLAEEIAEQTVTQAGEHSSGGQAPAAAEKTDAAGKDARKPASQATPKDATSTAQRRGK